MSRSLCLVHSLLLYHITYINGYFLKSLYNDHSLISQGLDVSEGADLHTIADVDESIKKRQLAKVDTDFSMYMEGATCPERRDMQNIGFARNPTLLVPIVWDCEEDGKFKPFLCGTFMCYCVNRLTGKTIRPSILATTCENETAMNQSNGYKCDEMLQDQVSYNSMLSDEEKSLTLVECDHHGNFKRKQCKNDYCTCVEPETCMFEPKRDPATSCFGRRRVPDTTLNSTGEKCETRRLRQRLLMVADTELQISVLWNCDKNGDYRSVQCSSTTCYCVDKDNGAIDWKTENVNETQCRNKHWTAEPTVVTTEMIELPNPYERYDKELCQLPPRTGPCRASIIVWYHDQTLNKCTTFIYGGCSPNANNFPSKQQCQYICQGLVT